MSDPAYVYAMVTELAGGARWVKFGYSTDPLARLDSVQTGCPLRIDVLLTVKCANVRLATLLEGALHLEHAEIRSSGEWFKWSDGKRAEPEAREALAMIGQRELGQAEVRRKELRKPQRAITGMKPTRGYAPVIGDVPAEGVEISVKRRKSLMCNG